jgi:hypothetical protein
MWHVSPQFFAGFQWLGTLPFLFMCAYVISKFISALQNRPRILKNEIKYQEWFASGCSKKNILTQLGGGRNCVRLVVTQELLWVTTCFPFLIIAPAYDMEHVIPLHRITNITTKQVFKTTIIELTFIGKNDQPRTLVLIPKYAQSFIQIIKLEQSHVGTKSTTIT